MSIQSDRELQILELQLAQLEDEAITRERTGTRISYKSKRWLEIKVELSSAKAAEDARSLGDIQTSNNTFHLP